jgi:hypothetical protein
MSSNLLNNENSENNTETLKKINVQQMEDGKTDESGNNTLIDKSKETFKESANENTNLGDPFWGNDYTILFKTDRLSHFFPTTEMSLIEKLNALFRLSIYLGIALYIFTANYLYLYIFIIIGAITYFIFYYQYDNINLYLNNAEDTNYNLIQKNLKENYKENFDNSRKPTVNNPFMNINLITTNPTIGASPPSWNNKEIQEEIEDKFNYNLYRDVGDLYGKNNSQRQFYTAPSTTIPNNQTAFAKWCYSSGPTCKEKSLYCSPQMNPVPFLDQTYPYKNNVVKY